jgi:hypothetical protein
MNKEYAKSLFGKGFHPLIDRLYERINPEQIAGIKQKYGRIDLYVDGTEEEQEFAYEIERESERTCELCGKPGELTEDNCWITALCDKCFNKRNL